MVRDPAATALAAELLLQGAGVWPFDSAKQALLISAIASVLPGIGSAAVSVTSTGAPFRRRLLQVMLCFAYLEDMPRLVMALQGTLDQSECFCFPWALLMRGYSIKQWGPCPGSGQYCSAAVF